MSEKVHEDIEPIIHEKIEPILKNLDVRLANLEKSLRTDIGKVENYTRENPIESLGITLLAGAGLVLLWSLIAHKTKD